MLLLVPFYFINEVTFAFVIFLASTSLYVFSGIVITILLYAFIKTFTNLNIPFFQAGSIFNYYIYLFYYNTKLNINSINLIRNVIIFKGFKTNLNHRKVFNKPDLNLGINLESIDYLNKYILNNLYGFKLKGKSLFNLDYYSLFNTIYGSNDINKLIDFEDFFSIMSICGEESYFDQENEYLNYGFNIGDNNINDIIALHNKNIKAAHGNLGLKRLIIANLNIITPGFTGNPFSTPLDTINEVKKCNPEVITPKSFYNNWLVSSYMLIWEYNILNRAKIYLESLSNSNSKKLPYDYEHAYILWQNRQFRIVKFNGSLLKQDLYIVNYNEYIVMYREICEDLLYVQLNLILAISILSYLHNKINNADFNRTLFTRDINNILINHIKKYSLGYSCLQELRVYSIKKHNIKHLKIIYDQYFKQDIDNKKYFESYYKGFLENRK